MANPDNPSLSEHASEVLRRRIIDGSMKPGARLAESAVAQDLGVSRVPVREALFALEREGLIEFSRTGRAYVKRLTARDFEELYQLRLLVEPAAARAAANVQGAALKALEENIEATRRARSLRDITRLDLDFHDGILAAAGHTRLLKLWRSMRQELELWLGRLHDRHQRQTRQTLRETVAAHEVLLAGLRTQSPATCERLMREHIQGWREWLPDLPEEN